MSTPVQRVIFNLVAQDVAATADFYTSIVGMKRHFDSDWYIILTPDEGAVLELGIIAADSPITPPQAVSNTPAGYLTLVVEDVHVAYANATKLSADIIEIPTPMPYGQTRMLLRDPNGVTVDVSSLTPSAE